MGFFHKGERPKSQGFQRPWRSHEGEADFIHGLLARLLQFIQPLR